jgi:hypothetical protein
MPLETFFGTIDKALNRGEIEFARRICQACPVLMDCAVFALTGHEETGPDSHGIWAGSTPNERAKILKQHKGNVQHSARYLVTEILTIDCEKPA